MVSVNSNRVYEELLFVNSLSTFVNNIHLFVFHLIQQSGSYIQVCTKQTRENSLYVKTYLAIKGILILLFEALFFSCFEFEV